MLFLGALSPKMLHVKETAVIEHEFFPAFRQQQGLERFMSDNNRQVAVGGTHTFLSAFHFTSVFGLDSAMSAFVSYTLLRLYSHIPGLSIQDYSMCSSPILIFRSHRLSVI